MHNIFIFRTQKIIYLFENEKRYLIDYANIKQGLISGQKDFWGKKDIKKYLKDISKGFPLVLPIGLKCFNYNNVKEILNDDTAMFKALNQLPKIMERPIVVKGEKAVLGRPPENVLGLL